MEGYIDGSNFKTHTYAPCAAFTPYIGRTKQDCGSFDKEFEKKFEITVWEGRTGREREEEEEQGTRQQSED